MGKKEVVRALLWAAVAFFTWQLVAQRIWPTPPPSEEEAPWQITDIGTPPGDNDIPTGSADADRLQPTTAADGEHRSGVHAVAGEPRTLVIGDAVDPRAEPYGLTVELSSVGASVVRAELSDYTITVKPDSDQYPVVSEGRGLNGETYRSYVTEKLHLRDLDLNLSLGDIPWSVESESENRVVFFLDIRNADTPMIRLRKTYALPDTTRHPMRYDLNVTLGLENLTDEDQTVILTQRGAVGVRREDPRMDNRALFVGFQTEGEVRCSTGTMARSLTKEESEALGGPLVWTAVANKYFVAFESYIGSTPGASEGDWIADVKKVPFEVDSENGTDITFRTATKPILIAANSSRALETVCYLGPKSRSAFRKVEDYVDLGFDSQVLSSYASGACCSFMAFKPLTVLMINLLNWLHVVVSNYGVAIIGLVLVVRLILHPVTKRGQVNMMRMQQEMGSVQPKMEELKKRYANDKAKLNQEVMKLYQEAGVNPATQMFSSCLPMLLQMPIWIALYTSLNFNIDMRHQPFCLWIQDLTAPDALVEFSKPFTVPLIGAMMGPIHSFNLLPILVSISMFAQQKLMPKPKPAATQSTTQSDQAAQMQKMMPYMTIVFGLFFYNMPSGLNLYIGASSFFGALEQWRIRKHIEQLKKQPPPSPKAVPTGGPPKPKVPKKPSFFQRLQKAAAEAQKVKSNKDKRKGKR